MKWVFNCGIFSLFFFAVDAFSQTSDSLSEDFTFKWENGFKLENLDKSIKLGFGGYFFIDHGYFTFDAHQPSYTENLSRSGTEIRTARLFFDGSIYERTRFKFQVDFASKKVTLKDVYIEITEIPAVGNFRVGHFKEPFRLSALTSSKYITFMERGANYFFTQSRNNGIMVYNDFLEDRISAQLGFFRDANSDSQDAFADDGYVFTGRLTALPYFNNQTKSLLHLGIGYSYRNPDSKKYDLGISSGSHMLPKILETEVFESIKHANFLNIEGLYLYKSFSFQSEFLTATIATDTDHKEFYSYYGEAGYFLTGESKSYAGSYKGLGRVKPIKNFGKDGSGAFEVALRYANTDFQKSTPQYGNQSEFTIGLNWYLNPVSRIMFNYSYIDIRDKMNLNVFQTRFQLDF